MFRTIARHEENSFGLPYPIVLIDAAQEEINETGEVVGIHIPNLEGLARTVAVTRCLIPIRFTGAEVRFIRKVIGKTAKQFAEDIELDAATYSRWENDRQTVGGWADKQVRQAAIILLRDSVSHLSLDPKLVVDLRFLPCGIEQIPNIEMVQATEDGCLRDEGCWDTNFRLAA